jgi:hypothetical protein
VVVSREFLTTLETKAIRSVKITQLSLSFKVIVALFLRPAIFPGCAGVLVVVGGCLVGQEDVHEDGGVQLPLPECVPMKLHEQYTQWAQQMNNSSNVAPKAKHELGHEPTSAQRCIHN